MIRIEAKETALLQGAPKEEVINAILANRNEILFLKTLTQSNFDHVFSEKLKEAINVLKAKGINEFRLNFKKKEDGNSSVICFRKRISKDSGYVVSVPCIAGFDVNIEVFESSLFSVPAHEFHGAEVPYAGYIGITELADDLCWSNDDLKCFLDDIEMASAYIMENQDFLCSGEEIIAGDFCL